LGRSSFKLATAAALALAIAAPVPPSPPLWPSNFRCWTNITGPSTPDVGVIYYNLDLLAQLSFHRWV
jgi:hypothetical protein